MKLKITVNDKTYEVDVNETGPAGLLRVTVDGTDFEVRMDADTAEGMPALAPAASPVVAVPQPSSPPPKTAPVKQPPRPAAASPQYSGPGTPVTAPMVGKILAVKVKQGARVKQGELLIVLEAMKMENDIVAPADGAVVSLSVETGSLVKQGDLLCAIE